MSTESLLKRAQATPRELSKVLGVTYNTATRKLDGTRNFVIADLPLLAKYLTKKLGRKVTVDELLK